MVEVTKFCFRNIFDKLKYDITKSSFIAIDTEFTGLTSDTRLKNTLFDTASDRYKLLKENIRDFIIIQFGLSTFSFNRDLNQYDATAYKFYLFPRSLGGIDERFLCQASSFEFLCRYNFDFNKMIYDGIPYLNTEQQNCLTDHLKQGTLIKFVLSSLESDEINLIRETCSSLSNWIQSAVISDVQSFTFPSIHEKFSYAIQEEIRTKFPSVWTYQEDNILKVKLVSEQQRQQLEVNNISRHSDLVDHFIGFSSVLKLLSQTQKPIVGHNALLDLMIIYKQFFSELPSNLNKFKKEINSLFPTIYDTKYIGYEFMRELKVEEKIEKTTLGGVYDYFVQKPSRKTVYAPKIVLATGLYDKVDARQLHDAGWDAYITGFCFIKFCQHFACARDGFVAKQLTTKEHFASMASFKNKLNLPRAAVTCLDLGGNESETDCRPPLLYLTCKSKQTLNMGQLSSMFAKYGGVNFKPVSSNSVLLAVINYASARDILNDFKKHKEIRVEKYNYLRHSRLIRVCLWGGVVVSASLATYVILKSS